MSILGVLIPICIINDTKPDLCDGKNNAAKRDRRIIFDIDKRALVSFITRSRINRYL